MCFQFSFTENFLLSNQSQAFHDEGSDKSDRCGEL